VATLTVAEVGNVLGNIYAVLLHMQAERRRDATRADWAAVQALAMDEEGVCKRLELLMRTLNQIRMDAANARLRLIAPVVSDYGADYERSKFQGKLDAGIVTVARTTAWIAQTLDGVVYLTHQIQMGSVLAKRTVLGEALATLICNGNDGERLRAETLPETLQLDVHHLEKLRREFKALLGMKALLTVMSATEEGRRLSPGAVSTLEAGEAVDVDALPEPLATAVKNGTREGNAVYELLRSRMRTFVRNCMVHDVPATVGDDIIPRTVSAALADRADGFIKHACRVALLNRAVHGERYSAIVDACLRA
jgi:hypothetical protein